MLPDTSPENVIENIITCYKRRNADQYGMLLSDNYRFYMSPTYQGTFSRLGIEQPDPADWTLELIPDSATGILNKTYFKTATQEMKSIRAMFNPAGNVRNLDLSFQYSPAGNKGADSIYFYLRAISLKITLKNTPEIIMVGDQGSLGQTILLLVRENASHWKILQWIDMTIGTGDDI